MNSNSGLKPVFFILLLIPFVQCLQGQGNESFIFSSDRDIKVTAESYSAEGKTLDTISLAFIPKPGQVLWLVWNTGADPITGTFEGLPEGSIVVVNRDGATYHFALSYKGGDGNDITLNRVAVPGQIVQSNEYHWSHLAGSTGGVGSSDGTGLLASVNTVTGMAYASDGSLLVSDTGNHRIRKVFPNGKMVTLAGTGIAGSIDGNASIATFNSPSGICVGIDGTVFVADKGNHKIRKINLDGSVVTFAGTGNAGFADGAANSAKFFFPESIAMGTDGSLYVADTYNSRIRKISPTGNVTTFAGSAITGGNDGIAANATFYYPNSIAIHNDGTVFVGESMKFRIRKITADGEVSTHAGSGVYGTSDGFGTSARFETPMALACNPGGGLLVGDRKIVRSIDTSGWVSKAFMGRTQPFGDVRAIAFGPDGEIAIASEGRIDRIKPGLDLLQTQAGLKNTSGSLDGNGKEARFTFPKGGTKDSYGNAYVIDNYTIRRISTNGMVTTLAGQYGLSGSTDGTGEIARFQNPKDITCASDGNLYVADSSKIRRITPAGIVTTMPTSGYGDHIAIASSGDLYLTREYSHTVLRVSPSGAVSVVAGKDGVSGSQDGTGIDARFNRPRGIAVDNLGNLIVADNGNRTIRRIRVTGQVETIAGKATQSGITDGMSDAARFIFPKHVSILPDGVILIGDGDTAVRKIYPNLQVKTICDADVKNLSGLVALNTDYAYLVDASSQIIQKLYMRDDVKKIQPFIGYPSPVMRTGTVNGVGSNARFQFDGGPGYGAAMVADGHGNVFVADPAHHVIRRVDSSSMVTTFAGGGGSGSADGLGAAARFNTPCGLSIDRSGNLFVADKGNHTIRMINPAGQVTTIAGMTGYSGYLDGPAGSARFSSPSAVAVDSSGVVYVADTGNRIIRSISPIDGVSTHAGSGSNGSMDGPNLAASFRNPNGIAVDHRGCVFVADAGDCIRKISIDRVVTTFAGSPGNKGSIDGFGTSARFGGGGLTFSSGLSTDAFGNLFFADTNNHTIRMVNKEGNVTTVGGLSGMQGYQLGFGIDSRFYNPLTVAVSSSGVLYAADRNFRLIKGVLAGFRPIIENPSASDTNSSSAKLDCQVFNNGYATEVFLEYGRSPSLGQVRSFANLGAEFSQKRELSISIDGLEPGLKYYYRFAAKNVDGSSFSEILTFNTLTPIESWLMRYFGPDSDPSYRSNEADPDQDNLNNLIEYALELPPNNPSRLVGLCRVSDGTLEYTYTRSSAAWGSGTVYQVEWSEDLESWSSLGVEEHIISDDGIHQRARASLPLGGKGKKFLRLRVH
jgi:sugar lactone lactonase YvrE